MKNNSLVVGTLTLLIASASCQTPTESRSVAAPLNAELWDAAQKGEIETVRALCDRGALVDAADAAGNTALMFASQGGHADTVELLLSKGARPNTRSAIGATALMYGCQYGYETVVQALLDARADVNLRHKRGASSPLMIASFRGHKRIVEVLLRHGAELTAQNDEGRTPLMLAAGSGHTAIVEMLVARGAEIRAQDKHGKTAIGYAVDGGFSDIADRLARRTQTRASHPGATKGKGDRKRDPEVIQDAARIKLLMAALGNRSALGGYKLQPDGRFVRQRPSWLRRVVDTMSKELDALLRKYKIDLATSEISSEGKFNMSTGTSPEGTYTELSIKMDEWSDLITVTPSGKFPTVKLKSGYLRLKLPSIELAFEQGAVCTVDGAEYVFRDGRWTAAE